jgi:hypothetical protein
MADRFKYSNTKAGNKNCITVIVHCCKIAPLLIFILSSHLQLIQCGKSSPATHRGGTWGERRYSSYSLMTLALYGDEWSASCPGCTPERTSGTHWIGWVGPRAGMDTNARGKIPSPLPGIEP